MLKRAVLFLFLFAQPAMAGTLFDASNSQEFRYDDAWWRMQQGKVFDRPSCQEIHDTIGNLRAFDLKNQTLNAPSSLAWSLFFSVKDCLASDRSLALWILEDVAAHGDGISIIVLAQFSYLEFGADDPMTRTRVERAKNAMGRLLTPNWRTLLYEPLVAGLKKEDVDLSPQLEDAFAWAESTLNGDSDEMYRIGLSLVDSGKYPEDKVLGCHWLSQAEAKGHRQARFRLGKQLALGEGVNVSAEKAMLLLSISASRDRNTDAYLLAADLLQRGDVYRKNLPEAYYALLKAQVLGENVKDVLLALEPQVSAQDRDIAQWRSTNEPSVLRLEPMTDQPWHLPCSYSER
ncbi:MAG: sel1 repeat family protein [Alphaproteobacteria bacterium]|nr:sel1 repeat family protein [Alphaproteobacteria bacterium]